MPVRERERRVARFKLHDKESKNCYRYTEVDADGNEVRGENCMIGQLYVQKHVLGSTAPRVIRVLLEF